MATAGEVNETVRKDVESIYKSLKPIRELFDFETASPFGQVNRPMVLVLGNHSSGKSTFINHILGAQVQKTGRAPTDATFSAIVGGDREERLDGRALVRSQEFGFEDFEKQFGRQFVSQLELKVVRDCKLLNDSGLMLIDSPGMIDPPGVSFATGGGVGGEAGEAVAQRGDMDRGYDFKRVVRWFADRCDVVLLFFDPDKPGTTYEALDVLCSSLQHVSEKVHIILNKVDDFSSVHDFARAYGTLCWNLSKMIHRKDIPMIYTMFVPPTNAAPAPTPVITPAPATVGGADSGASGASSASGASGASGDGDSRSDSSADGAAAAAAAAAADSAGSDDSSAAAAVPAAADAAAAEVTDETSLQAILEKEFGGIREEVIAEVRRAPERATDNAITQLKHSARSLKLHAEMINLCGERYRALKRHHKIIMGVTVGAGLMVCGLYLYRSLRLDTTALPLPRRNTLPSIKAIASEIGWEAALEERKRNGLNITDRGIKTVDHGSISSSSGGRGSSGSGNGGGSGSSSSSGGSTGRAGAGGGAVAQAASEQPLVAVGSGAAPATGSLRFRWTTFLSLLSLAGGCALNVWRQGVKELQQLQDELRRDTPFSLAACLRSGATTSSASGDQALLKVDAEQRAAEAGSLDEVGGGFTGNGRGASLLDRMFVANHRAQLLEGVPNRELLLSWRMVRPGVLLALQRMHLEDLPEFSDEARDLVADVLDTHVPRLDRFVRQRNPRVVRA